MRHKIKTAVSHYKICLMSNFLDVPNKYDFFFNYLDVFKCPEIFTICFLIRLNAVTIYMFDYVKRSISRTCNTLNGVFICESYSISVLIWLAYIALFYEN